MTIHANNGKKDEEGDSENKKPKPTKGEEPEHLKKAREKSMKESSQERSGSKLNDEAEVLNELIEEQYSSYDPDKIIEITSFEKLMEMSSVGGGSMQGYGAPFGDPQKIKKFNKKQAKQQRLKRQRCQLTEGSLSQYNPGSSSSTQIPTLSGGAVGRDADDPHGSPKTWLPQDVIKKFNAKEKQQQFHSTRNSKSTKLTEEEKDMINREDILIERKMRQYIRNKIKSLIHEQQKGADARRNATTPSNTSIIKRR